MADAKSAAPGEELSLKQLTPVLIVDAVEPCIKFWTDRLGFAVTNQVPGPDGKLVFASVEKAGIEIMYQTKASVISEQPGSAGELMGHSVALFITVKDLDTVAKALDGAPVVNRGARRFTEAPRSTFASQNTVGFAQFSWQL